MSNNIDQDIEEALLEAERLRESTTVTLSVPRGGNSK